MRIRLPLGRGLFFLLAFLLALVALLPLRLAADWFGAERSGVAARDAVGSVWGGVFHQAQVRDLQLGDLVASLKAFPLLAGRARVELGRNDAVRGAADNRADRLEGAITVSRNSYAIGDVTARVPLPPQRSPLPITAIDLSDVSARYVSDRCVSAQGAVTIETAGSIAGVAVPTSMTGTARCDGGALLLNLAGSGGLDQLSLRFPGGDRYRATLSVRPTDPALGQRLAASGFAAAGGVYTMSIEGRLR